MSSAPSRARSRRGARAPKALAAPRRRKPRRAPRRQGAPPHRSDAAAGAEAPAAASAAEEPAPPPPPQQEAPPAASAAAPPAAQAPGPRPRQAGGAGRRAASDPSVAAASEPQRAAAPQRSAEPQTQPEEAAPVRHDTRELVQRRFRIPADEPDKSGENLAFDFNDEPASSDSTSHNYAEEKWEVGDADIPPPPPSRPKNRIRISDIDDDLEGDAGLDRTFGRNPARISLRTATRIRISIAFVPRKSARRRTGWRRNCAAGRTSCTRPATLSGCSRWWS